MQKIQSSRAICFNQMVDFCGKERKNTLHVYLLRKKNYLKKIHLTGLFCSHKEKRPRKKRKNN